MVDTAIPFTPAPGYDVPGITEITSTGATVTVTDPAGPITDLEVAPSIPTLVSYAPTATAVYTPNTSTLTSLDGTNLTLPFTVGTDGKVTLEARIWVESDAGSASDEEQVWLGWLNHTGGAQVGLLERVIFVAFNITVADVGYVANIKQEVTGLTPGALQLDLAGLATVIGGSASVTFKASNGSGSPIVGPAVLSASPA